VDRGAADRRMSAQSSPCDGVLGYGINSACIWEPDTWLLIPSEREARFILSGAGASTPPPLPFKFHDD
jgi:hypothetical protein